MLIAIAMVLFAFSGINVWIGLVGNSKIAPFNYCCAIFCFGGALTVLALIASTGQI